jgi:hypothetical protein
MRTFNRSKILKMYDRSNLSKNLLFLCCLTLKMKVVGFFENTVTVYLSTRSKFPKSFVYHILVLLILNAWYMIHYLNFPPRK